MPLCEVCQIRQALRDDPVEALPAFSLDRLAVGGFPLTGQESALLAVLWARRGRIVHRAALVDLLWEDPDQSPEAPERALNVIVSRLRRALAAAGLHWVIKNSHGEGYGLAEIGSEFDRHGGSEPSAALRRISGRPLKVTDAQLAEMRALRGAGMPVAALAARFGLSRGWTYKLTRLAPRPRRRWWGMAASARDDAAAAGAPKPLPRVP